MANETLTHSSLAGLQVTKVQERSPYLNMLFYGDSGIGKTTLAGSASVVEGMYPVLDIDLEGGSESLRHSYPNVEVVRVKTAQQLQDVYNVLYDGDHGYNTVLLDSGTEIQNFSMTGIMKDLVEKNPDRDPDVPGMREYGKNLSQMRGIIRGFRDLEMHTIITALNMSKTNEFTGQTLMQPKFSGQFALEVSALLDVVLYYYVKNVNVDGEEVLKRLLLTQKTDTVVAKDRTGKLPLIIEDPTMQSIFDLMQSNVAVPGNLERLNDDGTVNAVVVDESDSEINI